MQRERYIKIENLLSSKKVIVVAAAMMIVNKVRQKPQAITAANGMSFYDIMINLTQDYDEVILVFDTYRPGSM